MTPDEITIAVTVYDRRKFIAEAIRSALAQTRKVRVMVMEDCGPDEGLKDFVTAMFGSEITYHRSPRRRGLFGNLNACIERCETPWLSILHDDDLLAPDFVESMMELSQAAPGRGLYLGQIHTMHADGTPFLTARESRDFAWREVDIRAAALCWPSGFPGQLIRVDVAKAVGMFPVTSRYAGDWDLWYRLSLAGGAATTNRVTSSFRAHDTIGRGTTTVDRNGRRFAYVIMQQKRNLHRLRQRGVDIKFNRKALYLNSPLAVKFLLRNAAGMGDWILKYNHGLLLLPAKCGSAHAIYRALAGILGPGFIRITSRISRWIEWPDYF